MRHLLLIAAAVGLLGSISGCATVPPWDREKLAHPTMTAQDLTSGLDDHVRAVSEGATGGLAGSGGGCGCN